jgi:hypothetical protein
MTQQLMLVMLMVVALKETARIKDSYPGLLELRFAMVEVFCLSAPPDGAMHILPMMQLMVAMVGMLMGMVGVETARVGDYCPGLLGQGFARVWVSLPAWRGFVTSLAVLGCWC